MPPSFVDLHCHSNASDGTMPPAEVVRLARESGLSGLSLTDHDTVLGVDEAAAEATRLGIDFIPGIEISCSYPRPGTLHLLGYGVDPHSPELASMTQGLVGARDERNARVVDALQKQGVAISMDEVLAASGAGTTGRPHIAAVLMRKGYVSSIREAFNKYLGQGGSAFFDKEQLSPRRAIEMIKNAGGVAVLAHPVQLRKENHAQLENAIKELVDFGLGGVEVIHSDHRASLVQELTELADRFGILMTGGSDFHGSGKPHIKLGWAGDRRIPRELFDRLHDRLSTSTEAADCKRHPRG
jgi:predicted metal-dependent phosphoesterase TrpH